MAVNGINGVSGSTATTSPAKSATGKTDLSQGDFMKLLLTQLQYQNPLEPVDNTEFAAQLAQFSTLNSMQQMNQSFQDLLLLQGLTQGSNLIGKTISFTSGENSTTAQGTVDSINVKNGQLFLNVGGKDVKLSQVQGLS